MMKTALKLLVLSMLSLSLEAAEMKLENIVTQSFQQNRSSIYMQRIAPNLEEYLEMRQKLRSHETLDINRSKDAYNRDQEDIIEDWQEVRVKMLRESIDLSQMHLVDIKYQEDQRLSQTLGRDALRYIFLNFAQGDRLFTIKLKECVKFATWKCGEGLSFKSIKIEGSSSSSKN